MRLADGGLKHNYHSLFPLQFGYYTIIIQSWKHEGGGIEIEWFKWLWAIFTNSWGIFYLCKLIFVFYICKLHFGGTWILCLLDITYTWYLLYCYFTSGTKQSHRRTFCPCNNYRFFVTKKFGLFVTKSNQIKLGKVLWNFVTQDMRIYTKYRFIKGSWTYGQIVKQT